MKNETVGACSTYGGRERLLKVFGGEPERKRPMGRPRHRWKESIKMALQEVGSRGMGWIELAQDRYRWRTHVNAVTNVRVP